MVSDFDRDERIVMDNLSLDEAARYLPLLDEAENHTSVLETVALPVLLGVLFLPGLLLGIFLPKNYALVLLAIVLASTIIFFAVLAKESSDPLMKKYARLAEEAGAEINDAKKFYTTWNGLKTKAKKRIRDDIERRKNAKNN